MPHGRNSSYNSTNIQRASRINTIETARLEKRLSYFNQELIHQCRLTNRAIRLICVSFEAIQSTSGHSVESCVTDTTIETSKETGSQTPFFLYGERIWTRKKRKLIKPFSANSRNLSHEEGVKVPDEFEKNQSQSGSYQRSTSENEQSLAPEASTGVMSRGGRVTPHQDWEDDTDEVTRKIFKNQARSMQGRRHTVYQSSGEVMISQAARTVRGLMRQIKISGGPRHDNEGATAPRGPYDDEKSRPKSSLPSGRQATNRVTKAEAKYRQTTQDIVEDHGNGTDFESKRKLTVCRSRPMSAFTC